MQKNKNVKVAFIIFSLQAGGAERNILNFLKYYKDPHIEPLVIAIKDVCDYIAEYPNEQKYVISLLSNNKIPLLLKPYKFFQILIKLFTIIHKVKIDILIGGAEYLPFYLVTFASIFLKKKTILIVGNNIVAQEKLRNKFIQKINFFLFSLSFKRATKIICVSKGLSESIERNYYVPSNKIVVIYNGVEVSKIQRIAKETLPNYYKKLFKNYHIISTVGRLTYQKGYDHLIRAFSIVKKSLPQSKLLIIGKGEIRNELNTLIQFFHLEKDVILIGFLNPDHYKLLMNSDVTVLTSQYEGFGNVLVEAFASGIPIISTDCKYGPREILLSTYIPYVNKLTYPMYGDFGILISPIPIVNTIINRLNFNDIQLADTILSVLNNKKITKFYHSNSRKRAYSFQIEKMVNEYSKIILN